VTDILAAGPLERSAKVEITESYELEVFHSRTALGIHRFLFVHLVGDEAFHNLPFFPIIQFVLVVKI